MKINYTAFKPIYLECKDGYRRRKGQDIIHDSCEADSLTDFKSIRNHIAENHAGYCLIACSKSETNI